MQVSVQIEGAQGLTWPIWQRLVSEVEELGFAGLYCCDHFANATPPDYASLEVLTAMTYAASHSARITLGTLVAPVSWRDPVMLARQGMAIDDLSGGRFVLGVGAGWNEREHRMFGYPLGNIPTRMDRFTEAVQVIADLMHGDGPRTFEGQYYHLRDAILLPRPGRPTPLLIGGAGPKRTLPLVARYADVWNVGPRTPDETRRLNGLLDDLLAQQGRAPNTLKRTMMQAIVCGRNRAEFEGRLRGYRRSPQLADLPQDELLTLLRAERGVIVGDPDEVIARIRALADAGIEEIMAQFIVVDDFEGLRLLAEEVLPQLG